VRVDKLLERRGMSRREVATLAEIPYLRFRAIEWGEVEMTSEEAARLRRVLRFRGRFD